MVAGGVLTAKQAPHRPGTAPALGLRAGRDRRRQERADHGRKGDISTMNLTCRILLGLGLTGALAAALGYFWSARPSPQAQDAGPEDIRSPEQEERRARLELDRARLFRSMEIKRKVAEALIDNQISLFQAVARFQRAEEGLPAAAWRLRVLRVQFPGNTDAELWCRKVIHYL